DGADSPLCALAMREAFADQGIRSDHRVRGLLCLRLGLRFCLRLLGWGGFGFRGLFLGHLVVLTRRGASRSPGRFCQNFLASCGRPRVVLVDRFRIPWTVQGGIFGRGEPSGLPPSSPLAGARSPAPERPRAASPTRLPPFDGKQAPEVSS